MDLTRLEPRPADDAPGPGGRRRLGPLVLAAVLAMLAVEGAWLVVGNLYARHRLLPALNRSPERTQVSWSHVDTWWPGVMRVRDLRLVKQTQEVQWELRADRARARCSLVPLLWKRFTVSGLEGRGVTFRLRFDPEGAPSEAAPEIAGLPDVPSVPPLPADRRRWTFRFVRCDVEDVREIWIGSFRLAGRSRAAASLTVTPGVRIEVPRFRLDVGEGSSVHVGDDLFVSGLSGTVASSLDPFRMEDRPPLDVFPELSARVDLAGTVHDVQLPRARFANVPWLGFGGGVGDARLAVRIDEGEFADGTRLDLAADAFQVAYPGYLVEGAAVVHGEVGPGAPGERRGRVDATFRRFTIAREGAPAAHVRGEGFSARLATDDLTLRRPLETYEVRLELPRSEIVSFDAYDASIPAPLRMSIESGTGDIEGELTVTEAGSSGRIGLQARDVVMTHGAHRLRSDLDLVGRVRDADLRAGTFDFSGTELHVREGTVEGRDDTQGWWGRFTMPTCSIRRGQPVSVDLTVDAVLRDSRPLLAIAFADRGLLRIFQPALVATDVRVTGGLRGGPGLVEVRDLAMRGDGAVIRACMDLTGTVRRGVVMADGGLVSGGFTFDGDERDVNVIAGEPWYERHAELCEDGPPVAN